MGRKYLRSIDERSMAAEYLMRVRGGCSTGEADVKAVVSAGGDSWLVREARERAKGSVGLTSRVEAAVAVMTEAHEEGSAFLQKQRLAVMSEALRHVMIATGLLPAGTEVEGPQLLLAAEAYVAAKRKESIGDGQRSKR